MTSYIAMLVLTNHNVKLENILIWKSDNGKQGEDL